MMPLQTKEIAKMGLLLSLGLVLSYVESLIPFYFGIPGAKLGLTNLMVLLVLYTYGWRWAVSLNVMRIILSGFLFGNLFGILYSFAGAFLSFLVMYLLWKKQYLSMTGVSIAGGVFHNVGQIIVASLLISKFSFLYYLPFLLVTGVIAGFLVGRLGQMIHDRGVL